LLVAGSMLLVNPKVEAFLSSIKFFKCVSNKINFIACKVVTYFKKPVTSNQQPAT